MQELRPLLPPGSLLLEYQLLVGILFAACLLLLESLLLEFRLLVGIPIAECLELPENLPPASLLVKSLSVARLPDEKFSQPEPLVTMRTAPRFQVSMRFRRVGGALRRDPRSLARHIPVSGENGQPVPQRSMIFS